MFWFVGCILFWVVLLLCPTCLLTVYLIIYCGGVLLFGWFLWIDRWLWFVVFIVVCMIAMLFMLNTCIHCHDDCCLWLILFVVVVLLCLWVLLEVWVWWLLVGCVLFVELCYVCALLLGFVLLLVLKVCILVSALVVFVL